MSKYRESENFKDFGRLVAGAFMPPIAVRSQVHDTFHFYLSCVLWVFFGALALEFSVIYYFVPLEHMAWVVGRYSDR